MASVMSQTIMRPRFSMLVYHFGLKKDYRIIGGFEHCDDVITWAIDDTLCPGFIFIVNIADDTK